MVCVCVHIQNRFDIKNGIVTYQCRFIRSDSYKKNLAANRIVMNSYGTRAVPDPCHTIFQRISSVFTEDNQTDNANISIYPMGDELYAFTECPIIHRYLLIQSPFFRYELFILVQCALSTH